MSTGATICKCCEAEVSQPIRMKFSTKSTQFKKLMVFLCARCDGPALNLSMRKETKYFNPDNPDNYDYA